jgi:hypothetical protein
MSIYPEPETLFAEILPYTGEIPGAPQAAVPPLPMIQTKTQYTTAVAVQKPRKLNSVIAAVLEEAVHAKEAFYYSFPMGGKKVEGPSIGLAMAVARAWGNCACPVEYYEQGGEWIFNAHFIDLETGFTVSRVFRKKVGKGLFKKLDDERAEDMTFQAAQSRAIRNVVTAGVPRWLLQQAIDRAKEAVLNGITKEGIAHATEGALKFLAGYGVVPEQVEQVLDKKVDKWDAEDLATLRGMASQLKDGQTTAAQMFPPVAKPEPSGKKPPEPTKEKPTTAKPEDKMDKQQTKVVGPPKEPPIAGTPVPPQDTEFSPLPGGVPDQNRIHENHNEIAPETTKGTEDPIGMTAAEYASEEKTLWGMVVAKGVDLGEMKRWTGVGRREEITPDNIANVKAYVVQWSAPGKGGRKK